MYCNQCGCEINDTAKFCKKCGSVVEPELKQDSEAKQKAVRFLYTNRKKLVIAVVALLVVAAAATAGILIWQEQARQAEKEAAKEIVIIKVESIDFQKDYEIDEDQLELGTLHATYSDGTVTELTDYKVYIDALEYAVEDGVINAEGIEDGDHKIRVEWAEKGQAFSYEKTIPIKHKVNTWGKYPNLPGMTGKEIAAAYGAMSAPEFGGFSAGDWGYAYVELQSINVQLCFPAGLFENPSDYGTSDARCLEMSSTLGDLYYNMEDEMSLDELREILDLNLTESSSGGCTGTLGSGNRIYIGEGYVFDDVYSSDTSVRVTVSDEKRAEILDYFF